MTEQVFDLPPLSFGEASNPIPDVNYLLPFVLDED